MELGDKRVTVMGLGRFGGGGGVARFLAEQGATVTVTDLAGHARLKPSLDALADLDLVYHLNGHVESDFTDTDLVAHSPAVPLTSPCLLAAKRAGVPLTSEMELFLGRCEGRTIGITGTAGKSTTTAMLAAILQRGAPTRVWCGGNIGGSLLSDLPRIGTDHLVVLELSSFQLENLARIRKSPRLAVVTNIAENHLDRHGTLAAYADAKANIVRFQHAGDMAWMPDGDPFGGWGGLGSGQKRFMTWETPPEPFHLPVPGPHNQANAHAAATVARYLGVPREAIAQALAGFAGLPHRLQLVARNRGHICINDSKSTTPQATVQALRCFDRPVVAIVGGYDKKADLTPMCDELARRAAAVVCLGQTGPAIHDQVVASSGPARRPRAVTVDTLLAAVRAATDLVPAGGVVLLSPGCSSLDMFANYEERGDLFVELVRSLADR